MAPDNQYQDKQSIEKAKRGRNLAIAFGVAGMVGLFFLITIVKYVAP